MNTNAELRASIPRIPAECVTILREPTIEEDGELLFSLPGQAPQVLPMHLLDTCGGAAAAARFCRFMGREELAEQVEAKQRERESEARP